MFLITWSGDRGMCSKALVTPLLSLCLFIMQCECVFSYGFHMPDIVFLLLKLPLLNPFRGVSNFDSHVWIFTTATRNIMFAANKPVVFLCWLFHIILYMWEKANQAEDVWRKNKCTSDPQVIKKVASTSCCMHLCFPFAFSNSHKIMSAFLAESLFLTSSKVFVHLRCLELQHVNTLKLPLLWTSASLPES